MMNKEFTNFIEITVICTIYINDNVYDSSATILITRNCRMISCTHAPTCAFGRHSNCAFLTRFIC